MSTERWDVPSDRLKRIASSKSAPHLRECPMCTHRHETGQACGYQKTPSAPAVCRCSE